jgi:tetratricopeptide (TPR) repeat protein
MLLSLSPVSAKKNSRAASTTTILSGEQDKVLKQDILGYLRENSPRQSGEGWLYLARRYRELDEIEKAIALLKKTVRTERIPFPVRNEAQLLLAEILSDRKEYDSAVKELDRLLAWQPERPFEIRAKIARARLYGRGMTKFDDLLKAFERFFAKFPEANEAEEMKYLMGFERGYDLEIGMRALEAWEEIGRFPEPETADQGKLHVALMYAYDLSQPQKSLEFLKALSPAPTTKPSVEGLFVQAALLQFHLPDEPSRRAEGVYQEFRQATDDPLAYRISTVLLGHLLTSELEAHEQALEVFSELATLPARLTATPSVSLKKREEVAIEDRKWAILGWKMAGYAAEFRMKDPDRARAFYQKAVEQDKLSNPGAAEFWLAQALARTEPRLGAAAILFEKAYEKYRARKFAAARELFETFIASHPNHPLTREAQYRVAVMTDDDFKEYDKAIELYRRYVISALPQKSSWKLDVLYDWGRIDEVHYRIGNLLALHRKDPLSAITVFSDLAKAHPESSWAMQGLKDTIRLQREELGDENAAQNSMREFIRLFPVAKDTQVYRRDLYERLLGQKEIPAALAILRDYLDHSLPSEKDFLPLKRQWRDLAFHLQEERIRKDLEHAGQIDRIDLLAELVPVLALASTSEPLEAFREEIAALTDIDDGTRWKLTYQIGTHLFIDNPAKAKQVFTTLAANASGPVKLACLLTLGNIAYRIDKSIPEAISLYENAVTMVEPLHPWLETPTYRLGRLYLATGDGIRGMTQLELFARRFPRSRHLPKTYLALGEAAAVLNHPVQARRFYQRVIHLSPRLAESAKKALEELEQAITPDEWLRQRDPGRRRRTSPAGIPEVRPTANARKPASEDGSSADILPGELASATIEFFYDFPPEVVYQQFVASNAHPSPDRNLLANMLISILMREAPTAILEKAQRHYISLRMLRFPSVDQLITEVDQILTHRNYPEILSELHYRRALTLDLLKREHETAIKAYFEYLSFFPKGPRAETVRERIPQAYERATDTKNALRFYTRLIDDVTVRAEARVDASIRKARLQDIDQQKSEAIKTLEASLALDSPRKPEILLRLEKLTENFDYVRRALEAVGSESHRLLALKRLIKKAEEDRDFLTAENTFKAFRGSFSEEAALAWIEKKAEDLGKRGLISEIEHKIERFPEEAETPERLFRLANIVEGMENTTYRAQDLFYEITLVYPHSEFFRESKIRAENIRATKAVDELGVALKSGVKEGEGDELLLERSRLHRDSLQSMGKAQEDLEGLIKLFPQSALLDEAYLGLGDLTLNIDRDAVKARTLWEKGLTVSRNPDMRSKLSERINQLRVFQERVLFSEAPRDQEEGEHLIYRIWRVEDDPMRALGMIEAALRELSNRPHAARFNYLAGLIHESAGRDQEAKQRYEKALRSLYHPGCRKDRLLYRLARLARKNGDSNEAQHWFQALIRRYPLSRLSRSAFYWLYKQELAAEHFPQAHHYLDQLLGFRSIFPGVRDELQKKLKDLTARMNIAEMERLRQHSPSGGNPAFHFFIGKVLENDLRDYDRALVEYRKFLQSNPPISQARALLERMADLAAHKGDHVTAILYLDQLRKTFKPAPEQLDLVIKIGNLVEDKLAAPELANLFYETIVADYEQVPPVRHYAASKIRRLEEKRLAAAVKTRGPRKAKREYSEEDEEILEELDEIKAKYIDDLQDFVRAERELIALWDDSGDSAATLDIMRVLVKLNEEQLVDPQKAGEYYERWLEENPQDLLYDETLMSLYTLYMDKVRDGQKALRLLENFIRTYPNSPIIMEAELKLGKANELLVRNWDESRRIYQRIIDTKRNEPVVHEAYFRIGFVLREGFADYQSAILTWEEMNALFYQNSFAEQAQFAIAFTYEAYMRDYTKARESYEKLLNLYPNSSLQNQVREALLRIGGKQ